MKTRHKKRTKHSLFKRVFLHGLLLIFVVVVAVGTLFMAFGAGSEPHQIINRLAEGLATEIEPGSATQQKLQARLDALNFVSEKGLAIYEESGKKLAATGISPPPPLSLKEASSLGTIPKFRKKHGNTVAAVRIPSRTGTESAYLLVAWTQYGGHGHLLVPLLVIVLVVGLLSLPLARSITKPLERLTYTAQKIGKGDLHARTGISRPDEVGVLATTLDTMALQLEHRISREKELLADISHEIRTPLARIKVALELVDEIEGGPPDLKEQLLGILKDADELEKLVENVLMISKLDLTASDTKDGLLLNKGQVDLHDFLASAKSRFDTSHPTRELRTDMPQNSPSINVDAALIKRLIDNLLSNAGKYSESDSPIELTATFDDKSVEIVVKDQGIGVDEDDLPRLFDPFFRTDRSRARDIGGTGLGLTLCKRIVESHGGTIAASKGEPTGLNVRFTLPFK